ncbi:MAG TPA: AMP-binding protein [Bdellovibrionota bacterium]|jgi:O-succinylbenzoic acid--CoA ligase
MIRAWLRPESELVDLTDEIAKKANALHAAHAQGARFLALPVTDNRDAVTWIAASFHSPICFVPMPPDLPSPVHESRLAQLPGNGVTLSSAPQWNSQSVQLPDRKRLDDIWAVLFTSGSSGEPRGVAISGEALSASATAHGERCGAVPWLLNLPLFHVGGFSVASRGFFLNAPIGIASVQFSAEETAAWIAGGRVKGLSLVPTALFRLLQETSLDLSSLDVLLLGGASADDSLVRRAVERRVPVRLTYGMTEHASQIATERSAGGGLELLAGVLARTSDDGEIFVRSPCLASGYFQDGILVPLPQEKGFFPSGDLGEISGGRLKVLGRKSEMIVSGGKKIFPAEVEAALTGLPGLRDFAVLSLPDQEWGEIVCAAIVESTPGKFDPPAWKERVAERLERHKWPKRWVRVSRIPRSSAGKVLRQALRSEVERSYSQS